MISISVESGSGSERERKKVKVHRDKGFATKGKLKGSLKSEMKK